MPRGVFSVDAFWSLIGEANEACAESDPLDFPLAWLEWELAMLIEPAILSFAWRYAAAVDAALTPGVRAVACSAATDETRASELASWLVVAGRRTYEAALADPGALEATFERLARRGIHGRPSLTFRDVATRAWAANTGRPADEMPLRHI